jgi:hypothetical protein
MSLSGVEIVAALGASHNANQIHISGHSMNDAGTASLGDMDRFVAVGALGHAWAHFMVTMGAVGGEEGVAVRANVRTGR